MYSSLTIAGKYFCYRLTAANGKGHGIHSPFVFDFVTNVLNDKNDYPAYSSVEQLRKKLSSDRTLVFSEDYGAGAALSKGRASQNVSEIVARAAKRSKYAQLLFRIVRHYQPRYVLELGTSLGISTAYIASGNAGAAVTSCEGNPALATMAGNSFKELNLDNVRIVTGNFDRTLPQVICALPHVDMAFIDGNHREQPTICYFNQLLEKASPSSMLIFDDIHWSGGMENAWDRIRVHSSVMLSIDLFQFGIIFFRPEFKVKQHFIISF